jgi:hypothetical protein
MLPALFDRELYLQYLRYLTLSALGRKGSFISIFQLDHHYFACWSQASVNIGLNLGHIVGSGPLGQPE